MEMKDSPRLYDCDLCGVVKDDWLMCCRVASWEKVWLGVEVCTIGGRNGDR